MKGLNSSRNGRVRSRQRFGLLAQAGVSIGILYFAIRAYGIDSILRAIAESSNVRSNGLIPIVLLPFVGLFASALKWHVLLADRTMAQSLQLHWAGEFLSLAGIGSLGNDVYKYFRLRARNRVLRDLVTVRLLGSVGGTIAGILAFLGGWTGLGLLVVTVLSLNFSVRVRTLPQLALARFKVLTIAIVQMALVIWLLYLALLEPSSPTVADAAFLGIADLWALALPISYQGVGVREAIFASTGEALQASGVGYLRVAVLLSVSTVLIRLLGIVPFMLSRRDSRQSSQAK